MKSIQSLPFSPLVARTLKFIGILILLSTLVNYLLLPIPLNFGDVRWQLNLTTQLVERGLTPLLGIACLLLGLGAENPANPPKAGGKKPKDLKVWAFLFSLSLGVLFLLVVPFHLNNVQLANEQAQRRIAQDAIAAEKEIETRLNQQQGEISNLLQNQRQLEELIKTNQLSEAEVERLRQFQEDPQYLGQQATEFRDRLQAQIRNRRQKAEQRTNLEYLISALRIGTSSLLLAIGYITIGWQGLKSTGRGKAARVKTPKR